MKKIMILLVFAFMLLIIPANALALSGHLPFEPDFEFERVYNSDLLRKNANDYVEQKFNLPSNYFDVKNVAGKPFNTNSDIIAQSYAGIWFPSWRCSWRITPLFGIYEKR